MTLTESCIAAAIVASVMAIAMPSLVRAKETYSLESAAHDVAAKMQASRITAIARNQDCRLTVTSANSYVMECAPAATFQIVERITVPDGITVTGNNRPVFHRRGNVSPTATFIVSNAAGKSTQIVVNVNGRVRLQ